MIAMNKELLEVGKIVNTHGVRGDVKITPWTDTPDVFAKIKTLIIGGDTFKVKSSRVHKSLVISTLEYVDSIETAILLKNKVVLASRENIELEDGKYFISDIIGLRALNVNNANEELGIISDVLTLPAHRVYVIKGEREILIPAVPEFIAQTDIDKGYVKIRLIEGL